ncbi:hypothetical protein BOQ60_23570, partial [Chryseobacterium sp. CH1]
MVLAGKKGLSSQNYFTIYLFLSLCLELYGHYKIYIQKFDFAYLLIITVFFCLYFSTDTMQESSLKNSEYS